MIELFFREYGHGAPTLVILHGLLGSSQNWQRAAKSFAEKCRVLAVDQRNHGSSPHTATHTFADLRDAIEEASQPGGTAPGPSAPGMAIPANASPEEVAELERQMKLLGYM